MIEAGKTYRLRGGLTARIGFTDKKGSRPISGLVDIGERENHQTWYADGRAYADMASDCDIVMPEPERESGWLNWYGTGNGIYIFRTRNDAERGTLSGRTHVLEIITENGEPVDVKIHKVTK